MAHEAKGLKDKKMLFCVGEGLYVKLQVIGPSSLSHASQIWHSARVIIPVLKYSKYAFEPLIFLVWI